MGAKALAKQVAAATLVGRSVGFTIARASERAEDTQQPPMVGGRDKDFPAERRAQEPYCASARPLATAGHAPVGG